MSDQLNLCANCGDAYTLGRLCRSCAEQEAIDNDNYAGGYDMEEDAWDRENEEWDDLEDVEYGDTVYFSLEDDGERKTCQACNGTGQGWDLTPCQECDGEGFYYWL